MPEGFLLVDKPGGWTSHDVVAKVRRLAGVKKTGHAGTLDPMATGLLVLAMGRTTRLIRFVQALTKHYEATALFGVATDTLDADGAVLSREPMPVSAADVEEVAKRFVGEILQVPPMVSARRVAGRRLYELAREGHTVEREARPVVISRLEVLDLAPSDYPEVTFSVVCSSGTYVRTLADDMAAALGGRAHLTALRRVAIGSLHVDRAATIDDLEAAAAAGRLADHVLPPASGLADLPALHPPPEVQTGVRHGVSFALPLLGSDIVAEGPFRVLDDEGRLLAVYRASGKQAVAEVVTA